MSKRVLFIAAAVVLLGAGLYFRSANSRLAKAQAAEIVKLDAAGADSTAALAALTNFSATHMGATVTVNMNASYDRAQASAVAAAAATSSASSKVYADAQRVCSGKSDSVTAARCHQNYISQHLNTGPTPTPIPAPRRTDYQKVIKAPAWTPDLAGSLLAGGAAAGVFSVIIGKKKKGSR